MLRISAISWLLLPRSTPLEDLGLACGEDFTRFDPMYASGCGPLAILGTQPS